MIASERQGSANREWLTATALVLVLTGTAQAQFITPEQAGFHHCVLLYDADSRTADDLLPHVAHLTADGTPDQWLFDAFLLCAHLPGPSTQASYHFGPTNRADWEGLQDGWFVEGHGLSALQEAIDHAERVFGPVPRPLEVVLTIPYPSAQQIDFGDVDGDGVSEDLSLPGCREAAVAWYVDRALAQWERLDAPDLHLWGFYWTREGIAAGDPEIVQHTAGLVHERGYQLLWIPWFRAPGFEGWRGFGFDVAILQPNYAFLPQHLGKVRNDRLVETAALARDLGMGVEMEISYSPERDLREREIFRDYLAFGHRSLCGYQQAATAYFQSLQVFPNLCHAGDPDARHAYDEIAAYVRGEPVARPGWLREATATLTQGAETVSVPSLVDGVIATGAGDAALVTVLGSGTIEVSLPQPRTVGEVEVSVLRHGSPWTGVIAVETRGAAGGDWAPAGWAKVVVPAKDDQARLKHVIAVPLPKTEARALRVHLRPDRPGVLLIDEISANAGGGVPSEDVGNLARGCPYRVRPEPPRQYPDRGGILTDGEVSDQGWSQGRSVGWLGADVTVNLDLGEVRPIDRVVVHCDGGGSASVHFPERLTLEFGSDAPPVPPGTVGQGPPPEPSGGTVIANGSAVEVVGERPVGDLTTAWGHFDIRPPEGTSARFVAFRFAVRGWLMVSEIEVWSQGANVAPDATYTVAPAPAATEEERYADDGLRLTDGFVARAWNAKRISGWTGAEEVEIILDLGAARPVAEVTVHTLGGGLYGVLAPPSAQVELSLDGTRFTSAGPAAATDPGGDTCVHLPLAFRLPQPQQARFVRVRVQPSPQWTMLSEITVR